MLPQGRDIGGGRRTSKLSSRAVETGCRISSICRTMRAPLASLGMAGDRTFSFFRLLVRILWLIAVGGGTHVLPCRASQICNEDPTLVISELRLLPASTSNPGFVELFNPLPVEVCLDAIEVRVERKAEQNGEFRTTYRFDDCRMCNSEGKGCCETLAPFSFRVIEQQGNGIFETPCSLSMLPEWSSPPTSVYLTNKTDGSTLDFTIVPTELPLHWSWARPGDDKFECPGLFEPTSHPTPQSFNTFEALSLKKTDVERQATAVLNNFSEEEIHSLLHCNKGKVVPEQLEKGYYTKGKYFTGIWGKGYYLKDVYHPRFEFKEYRPGYCTWVGDPRQEKAKFFRKPYIRCQRGEWSQARFRDGYYREDIEPPFWIRGGVFAVGYYVPQNVTMPKYIPSKCEAKQVLEVGQLKVPPTGSGITPYTFLCIWYKLPTPCNVVANRATITPTGVYIRDDALAPAPQGADMQEVSFPGSGA